MNYANEHELAQFIKQRNHPLEIVGGATRRLGLPLNLEQINVTQFNTIKLYEPSALTLIAGAGCKLTDIIALLKENGQMLPFEPIDMRGLLNTTGDSTLGGMIATNASGSRRVKVGACRDFVLGLRFINGEGKILKTGGRVMKNVTGYDLVKLLCGSYGTLGIITEVSIKVLPAPEHTSVILAEGLSEFKGLDALRKSLASPYEVSGAAHLVSGQDGNSVTMIRIEGTVQSVNYRVHELTQLLSPLVSINVESDPEKTRLGWDYVSNAKPFWNQPGDVWKIVIKPTEAIKQINKIRERTTSDVIYDWGGGLVWVLVPEGTPLREYLGTFPGYATLIRGSQATLNHMPVFHPKDKPLQDLTTRIKRQFDPQNHFNRGFNI